MFIWCECCKAIKPLLRDEMGGKSADGNFQGACDLLCDFCHYVIATTYEGKARCIHEIPLDDECELCGYYSIEVNQPARESTT